MARPACNPRSNATGIGDLGSASGSCVVPSETVTCNPMVQSYTCNWYSGSACDFQPAGVPTGAKGFSCSAAPRHHICDACGPIEGGCHFGLTCAFDGQRGQYECARFCCDDADCYGGKCDTARVDYRFASLGGQPMGSSV